MRISSNVITNTFSTRFQFHSFWNFACKGLVDYCSRRHRNPEQKKTCHFLLGWGREGLGMRWFGEQNNRINQFDICYVCYFPGKLSFFRHFFCLRFAYVLQYRIWRSYMLTKESYSGFQFLSYQSFNCQKIRLYLRFSLRRMLFYRCVVWIACICRLK